MRKLSALWLCFALNASPAFAQTSDQSVTSVPPSPAKAQADALIKAAEASDLFENVTDGASARVKHTASGLICGFDDNPTARIVVFPNAVRGNDIGCVSKIGDVLISFYATKLSPEAKLSDLFAQTLSGLKPIYPDIKGYSGKVASMSADGVQTGETTYFVVKDKDGRITGKPGTDVISRLSMAQIKDGWVVKLRASTPNTGEQSAMNLSVVSSIVWMGRMMEFAPAKPAKPTP